MATKTSFANFPAGTLKFLKGLRANNTKKWFEAHRAEYDEFYVEAGKSFVEAVGAKLVKLAPQVKADPRINGSIYRINRDIRFSKDKQPYKDHLDFSFWEGDKKASASSLFFRVSPAGVFVGAGFHQSCGAQLKAFREAVADSDSGEGLARVAKKIRRSGHELQGKHYKRFPRDFPSDGPAAEFLLHDGLYVLHEDKPETATKKGIVDLCIKHWRSAMPLHRWLIDHVRL